MLTPQDVRAAQFEKNIRGYRTEEVDRFLDKVEEQLKIRLRSCAARSLS